jgi:transcriptional regulator with XRE-family HTH domain
MDRRKLEENQKEIMIRLSKRIKEERESRNWDVLELVIRSGVSQSTIYNLETGLVDNVGLKNLTGIAIAFEMDILSLMK